MRNGAALERVRKRARDMPLADEIFEAAGPITVVEALSGICHVRVKSVTVHPPSNTCREVELRDMTPARWPHCAWEGPLKAASFRT